MKSIYKEKSMLVTSYNNKGLNDILVIMKKKSEVSDQSFERKGQVTQIVDKETNEVVGYNIFEASSVVEGLDNGSVTLSEEQVEKVNTVIKEAGFEETVVADTTPKFVVGFVKESVPHEDSDHLNVTQTEVDNGEVLQIVCGASNIAQGQKVVVAKPGAVMPNGLVIWPGELRGVKSHGMICSAKELGIESDQKKGILVLEESEETGKPFVK